MRIAVVVCTFDSPVALRKALQGYAMQSRTPDEVVVADDGSGTDTKHLIDDLRSQVPFRLAHVWQENQGYRRSRILNMGVAASTADYLLFTDGDCLPHREFVADHERLAEQGYWVQGKRAQIREQHAAQAQAADASGLALLRRGWLWRSAYGLRWLWPVVWRQHGALRERALGSNMAMWREDLLAVNGFNEAFVGWGSEDREVTVRLYHLGRRKKFVLGRALQYHLDHPAASRQHAKDNGHILARVRAERVKRCDQGLSLHLGQPMNLDPAVDRSHPQASPHECSH